MTQTAIGVAGLGLEVDLSRILLLITLKVSAVSVLLQNVSVGLSTSSVLLEYSKQVDDAELVS